MEGNLIVFAICFAGLFIGFSIHSGLNNIRDEIKKLIDK